MRHYSFILLVCTGFILMPSCKKKETISACLTVDKSDVLTGEVVQFTNCSVDYVDSEWDFGDGTESEVSNTSHRYYEAGDYTVVLRVKDLDGASSEMTSSISVSDLRIASIEVSHANIDNSQYFWDFQYNNEGIGNFNLNTTIDSTVSGKHIYSYSSPELMKNQEYTLSTTTYDQNDFWNVSFESEIIFNPYKELTSGETSITIKDNSLQAKFNFEKSK